MSRTEVHRRSLDMRKELSVDEDSVVVKVERQVRVRDRLVDIPIKYKCRSAINAVFPVSTREVRGLIASPKLKPLEILPGKSLLCITVFDYSWTPVGPFAELTYSVAVGYNCRLAVPLLSIPMTMLLGKLGFYVVSIAQSTEIAIEHGNAITGYPHFGRTIGMKFETDGDLISAEAFDKDKRILELRITKPPKEKVKRESHATYVVKDGRLSKIGMDVYGILGGSKVHQLELGNHELSDYLRKLQISSRSIYTMYYRDTIEVLNSPAMLETA